MQLSSITLTDITAFTAPATLDFSRLPPGLIALVGANGSGKTTTLEAPLACWFRAFPSREKALVDYATSANAAIDIRFELDGRGFYRTRLALDGVHRKANAVLTQLLPDGREQPLSDGKLTTFDAAIADLLPSQALLLASVFAAQNRAGSFITADATDRMALLSALLGLEHYAVLADRARQWVRETLVTVTRLEDRIAILEPSTSAEAQDALALSADDLSTRHAEAVRWLGDVSGQIEALRAELLTLEVQAIAHQHAQRDEITLGAQWGQIHVRFGGLTTALASYDGDTSARRTALKVAAKREQLDLEADMRERSILVDEGTAINTAANRELLDLHERITNNQALIAKAEEIRAAVARRAEIADLFVSARAGLADIGRDKEALRATREALTAAGHTLAADDCRLAEAQAQAGLLGNVPCGGEGIYAGCPVLGHAQEAKAAIPDLQTAVALRPSWHVLVAGNAAELAECERVAGEGLAAIAALTEEDNRLVRTANRIANLEASESKIAEYERQIAACEQRRIEALQAASGREGVRQAQLSTRLTLRATYHAETLRTFEADRTAGRARLASELAQVERDGADVTTRLLAARATLEATHDASEQTAALRTTLSGLTEDRRQAELTLASLTAKREDLDRRLAEQAAALVERARLDGYLVELRDDLVNAQLLADCYGRDGLPLLEVDDAGPAVSALTNELLEAALGERRFTVELITQRAKLSKSKTGESMRDVLDLAILDASADGAPRSLSDLSGGEQVLVDEALKCGIALYMNRRTPYPFRTCWRDETTGALDPENTLRYLAMIRKTHEIGGFTHTLFVSQNPDAWALADARVHVVDGQFTIEGVS